jgi:CDP-paratose 2-epimerase
MKNSSVLITGGAGFIGINLADRLIAGGEKIAIYDNLSRAGCRANLEWLREKHGAQSFHLIQADVVDYDALCRAMDGVERIYHLAGQVAVTTSEKNPRFDFESNALGTFNALEAARHFANDPIFIYSSTNKVYGKMENVAVVEEETRYRFSDLPFGISEAEPLDFHSPYGCSKGSGDQYTRDYARMYGLKTVVVRQSCIYGPRQFGIEDQGWLAWFVIAAVNRRSICIYGNGKQVRDVLHVYDLISLYQAAVDNIAVAAGQVYNVGGGAENTISVWTEFSKLLERLLGYSIPVSFGDWRPGDQHVYVSDIRRAERELGWSPTISIEEGAKLLIEWVRKNQHLFV